MTNKKSRQQLKKEATVNDTFKKLTDDFSGKRNLIVHYNEGSVIIEEEAYKELFNDCNARWKAFANRWNLNPKNKRSNVLCNYSAFRKFAEAYLSREKLFVWTAYARHRLEDHYGYYDYNPDTLKLLYNHGMIAEEAAIKLTCEIAA